MVATLIGTTGTFSFHSSPGRRCRNASAGKGTRHRCRLRTIASANQTGTAIYDLVSRGKSFARRGKLAFSSSMADFDRERDGIWDVYWWERFLQQQDQRTGEIHGSALEKYIDDPEPDENHRP